MKRIVAVMVMCFFASIVSAASKPNSRSNQAKKTTTTVKAKTVKLKNGGYEFLGILTPPTTLKALPNNKLRVQTITTTKPVAEVFRDMGNLGKLCLIKGEIKGYVATYGNKTDPPMFFLQQINTEYFLVTAYFDAGLGGFGLITFPMEDSSPPLAERRLRIVTRRQ